MKLASIFLTGMICGGLLACSELPFVDVHNNSGQAISFVVPKGPGKTKVVVIQTGRHKKIRRFILRPQLALEAGRCVYRYQPRGVIEHVTFTPTVQVEPDFSVHLLATGHEAYELGRFIDEQGEGFPMRPESQTCDQAGLNTSAPSQAAASARL